MSAAQPPRSEAPGALPVAAAPRHADTPAPPSPATPPPARGDERPCWHADPRRSAVDNVTQLLELLRSRLRAAVVGRDEVIDLVLVALLADGHVLLEDYPGSGKTTLAKALGASILPDEPSASAATAAAGWPPFRRIQFTPDLLPSDVTGVMVFDGDSNSFRFRPGPIFAHMVLADEINRTSPKVQAAMLEAMAEKQVTVDNRTHRLDPLFFVLATQNPLDLAGTYPLPLSQLDRFLFKVRMQHIDRAAELEVLRTWRQRLQPPGSPLPMVRRGDLLRAREVARAAVHVAAAVQECLVDLARAIREHPSVLQGTSTRSLVLAVPALQARALLHRRDYVCSEDVHALAPTIFAHRVEVIPGGPDAVEVVTEAAAAPLEALARKTASGH